MIPDNASTEVLLQRIVNQFTRIDVDKFPVFSVLTDFETYLTICRSAYILADRLGTPLSTAGENLAIFISGNTRIISRSQFEQFISNCRQKMGLHAKSFQNN